MKQLTCRILIVFAAFVIFSDLEALARVDLGVWQSSPSSPRVIIPVPENQTPQQALDAYLHHISANPELSSLFMRERQSLPKAQGSIEILKGSANPTRPLTALIANSAEDMQPSGERISRNTQVFTRAGGDVYVIAIGADVALGDKEKVEFREKIAREIKLLVALGGDDLDPSLYGESPTHAKNFNSVRDQSEVELIKRFKAEEKGIFFGVCRGHQAGAIADGHRLFQDLSANGVGSSNEHVNEHGADSNARQRWHHVTVNDSLLFKFLKDSTPLVNSIHHQSVNANPNGKSRPVAFHEGVIEALEMKNGLGLSLQWHGEFPADVSGNESFSNQNFRVLRGMVALARKARMNSCPRLFSRAAFLL